MRRNTRAKALLLGLALLAGSLPALRARPPEHHHRAHGPPLRWWKGNLHTHSLWSDGDDYPEMIVDWYKRHGYHFVALSDHNVLAEGEKWIEAGKSRGGRPALQRYRERFGDAWIDRRVEKGRSRVRLKTLAEYRAIFETHNRFLVLQSEEITDRFGALPIHLNATNLRERIPPPGGNSVQEVMQNAIDAVFAQRRRTGQAMFPHLNHPNFGWAVTAEQIAALRGERFFEVYNGHPGAGNNGDAKHAGTERMWDIALARRLAAPGGEILFGVATDDAHDYHSRGARRSNPGRGWVVVRARRLTPRSLITAMEAGDFYASTGVRLRDVRWDGDSLAIEIEPEPGVQYTTQFIGTRRSRRAVGAVLARVQGVSPRYRPRGDELYVRATIRSSKPQANPGAPGEVERAWTQPVLPGAR